MSKLDKLNAKIEHLEGELRATQDVTAFMFKFFIKKKERLAFSKFVSKFGGSLAPHQPPKLRPGYRAAVRKMAKKSSTVKLNSWLVSSEQEQSHIIFSLCL